MCLRSLDFEHAHVSLKINILNMSIHVSFKHDFKYAHVPEKISNMILDISMSLRE